MNRFETFARQVSTNDTRTCWVLKMRCEEILRLSKSDNADRYFAFLYFRRKYFVATRESDWEFFESTAPGKGLPLPETSPPASREYLHERI